MKEGQKNFRLSEQAQQALEAMHRETGTNRTAIVEQAIIFYSKLGAAARVIDLYGLTTQAHEDITVSFDS